MYPEEINSSTCPQLPTEMYRSIRFHLAAGLLKDNLKFPKSLLMDTRLPLHRQAHYLYSVGKLFWKFGYCHYIVGDPYYRLQSIHISYGSAVMAYYYKRSSSHDWEMGLTK